jgi:monothiol glutaredoxin
MPTGRAVHPMSVRELRQLVDSGEPFELLDVRTHAECLIARIEGARRLDEELEQDLLELDRGARLVFVCHHGIRSRAAAEWFLAQGFEDVYNVEGGIDAWSREIDPNVPRY